MSIIPTTRAGYLFGARRRKIPWESEGPDTGKRFQEGRASRMAGQKDISGLRPGYLDAPYGVGRGFNPNKSDTLEIDTSEDTWRTFDNQLEPRERSPYG